MLGKWMPEDKKEDISKRRKAMLFFVIWEAEA
jgi:hypothetical protein